MVLKQLAKYLLPKYYSQAEPIGGDESVVQIDKSKFGKRKYNKRHKVTGCGFQPQLKKKPTRRIKLFVVPDRKESILSEILTTNAKEDSIVYTDMEKVYLKL